MARWQFKEERAYFLYVTIEADSKEEAIEKFQAGDFEDWDDQGDEDVAGTFVCEVDEDDNVISDEEEI